ncbi:MAG: hypothetical protein ACSHX0_06810 [Akkermansiaceae bacterium]
MNIEQLSAALLADLYKYDDLEGLTDNWGGNGCFHGFKPASSCPNNCEDAQSNKLWNEILEKARSLAKGKENNI